MISTIDNGILLYLRNLCDESWILDYACYTLSDNNLLKGGVFISVLWWFWFRTKERERNRTVVASIFVSSLVVIGANQMLRMLAPVRLRPYVTGVTGVTFPFDLGLKLSSSFASDHAALFFGFATGFLFLSRRLGLAGFIYVTFLICLPRLLLGLHYPTDLLVGGAVGCITVFAIVGTRLRDIVAKPILKWVEVRPGSFYGCFFLLSYQIATLFDDMRELGVFCGIVYRNSR